VSEPEEQLPPPAGEDIHLPEPTYLPIVVAVGITIGLVGITLNFVISIVGAVIVLIAAVRWIRETRRDISELPLEHP
jgi:hypothetical protein